MTVGRHELRREDVEDVFPTNDTVALMIRQFHLRSWIRRHAYHIPDTKAETLRWALELCLEAHPMFLSMIYVRPSLYSVKYDPVKEQPLYVTLRPNAHVFAAVISEGHTVDKPSDLSTLHLENDSIDHAFRFGPPIRFLIVHIRSTSSVGLIYFGHHSAFDALSMSLFLSDLDTTLRTREPPRAAFKPFAKKFLCRSSPNVAAALAYHVSRLKGWSNHRSALWPLQRAPQLFCGCASQWTHTDGTLGLPHERPILTRLAQGVTGVHRVISVPNLPAIKITHSISAPTIFLAALALLNVRRTGSSQAFIGQPFDGRSLAHRDRLPGSYPAEHNKYRRPNMGSRHQPYLHPPRATASVPPPRH